MVMGLSVMAMVTMAIAALLIQASYAFGMTTAQSNITNMNAQGIRYASEQLRKAMSVTIVSNVRVDYVLPKLADTADPVSGEREYTVPMVSDGVVHSLRVDFAAGTLKDFATGQILCRNLISADPDPSSTQYKKTTAPFQATSVGSVRAIQLTLITTDQVGTKTTYTRLKSTAMVRNVLQ
jgi:hypothetical protein